jgi:hypothetical protein
VGTHDLDLDDSEIVDADEGGTDDNDDAIVISSDEDDALKKPARKKAATVKVETIALCLGPITRRIVSNRLDTPSAPIYNSRASWNAPTDLLQSISRSLNPSLSTV